MEEEEKGEEEKEKEKGRGGGGGGGDRQTTQLSVSNVPTCFLYLVYRADSGESVCNRCFGFRESYFYVFSPLFWCFSKISCMP